MNTIEKQLFDWESWDQFDTAKFCFSDCTLKVPIGDISAGQKFPVINVDYEKSVLELFSDADDENPIRFNLRLTVGEKLPT